MLFEKKNKSLSYNLIRYIIANDRNNFLFAIIISIIGGFIELLGIASIYPLLLLLNNPTIIEENYILQWIYIYRNYSNEQSFIFDAALLALFCFVFMNVFMFFKNAFIFHLSFSTTRKISVRLLRSYLLKPYTYFINHNSSEISKNILTQSDIVASGILLSWMVVISEFFIIVSIIGLILFTDLKTGIITLALLISIIGIIYYSFRNKIYIIGAISDDANKNRFTYCLEALGAIKEIKSAQKEEAFCEAFLPHAKKLANAHIKANNIQILPNYITQTVIVIFVIGLILFYLYKGIPILNIVPVISLYAISSYRLMPSLTKFSGAISQLRQNRVVFNNVVKILSVSTDKIKKNNSGKKINIDNRIRLHDVAFAYPGSKEAIFNNLNIEFKKQTFTSIVGVSGSGKTTLIDILLGLLPVDKGWIEIDDIVVTESLLPSWKNMIGYIPQSIFLMDNSIASNIAFGVPESEFNWDNLNKAVSMSDLDEFIKNLPEGFHTNVGERGGRISGGQLQRIGIARALYYDPKILIMDESTSSLDGISEQNIVETILELKREKIIIVVAHRQSTIRNSDQIILLDKGKIIDIGTYNELFARCTHFIKLMSNQNFEKKL